MAEWQPDETGLAQVVELAHMARQPRQYQEALNRLTEYNQNPEFNMYLAFSFVNCTSESIETRMMISIILKENVIRYWKLMPPEVQQYIMSIVPNLISDPDLHLRELCGALICAILAQTHISGWPNIVFDLIGALDSDNANLVLGAFGTISKLFEDHGRELCQPLPDFPQQPTEILVPKLLQMMSPEHEDLLNLSLQIFIHMIPWKPAALLVHINDFFQILFALAENPSSEAILINVCRTFDALVFGRVTAIMDYMNDVVQYMLIMTDSDRPQVAFAASNFWRTMADSEACYEALGPYLPQVVETLLRHMKYSEDELDQLPDVEEDVSAPDKPENTVPTTGKILMGDNLQATYDTTMGVAETTLRKNCGYGLEELTNVFGEELLEIIIPLCSEGLASHDWLEREACVLALGATSASFLYCGTEHLPGMIPILLGLLSDSRALIRHVAAWAVSRYSQWIVKQDDLLQPTVDSLLRQLRDRSKMVVAWALQSLAILSDHAEAHMRYYVDDLLPVYMEMYQHLMGTPLAKLYDAIGALAQAVGEAMNEPHLLEILMPPIMARWETMDESDEKCSAFIDCVTRICIGLGIGFAPYVPAVWERAVRITQTYVVASTMAKENPALDEPSPKLLVCSLELIAAIVEALKAGATDLFVDYNLVPLLVEVLKDTSVAVSRASFVLAGDIASTCYPIIAPALEHVLPILVTNIRTRARHVSISLNACWAVKEIALHAGELMGPYAQETTNRCIMIIHDENQHEQLHNNAAVLLGVIALHFPGVVAIDLESFVAPWCTVLANLEEDDDKKTSYLGLLAVIRENPEALLEHFHIFANAAASWGLPPASVQQPMAEIFKEYQEQLGPEAWGQLLSSVTEDDLANLQRWYM